jgi:hypothetical protein
MRALALAVMASGFAAFACSPAQQGMSNTTGAGGTGGSGGRGGSGGSSVSGTGGSGGSAGASAGSGASTGGSGGAAGAGGGSAGSGGAGGSGGTGSGGSGGASDGGAADTAGGTGGTGGSGGETPAGALDGVAQVRLRSVIGLGYFTACHVMPDTTLRCFGDRHPRTMPPAGLKTRHVTCAHDGCCALMPKEAGGPRIRCWSDKQTIIPPGGFATSVDPIQIVIGYQHGCALNADGSVACYGQPGTMNAPPPGLKAKSLYAAAFFTCAVKLDDTVTCWGVNPPMPPPDLKAKLVSAIVHTGGHLDEAPGLTRHACAIQLDDTVRCWGDNVEGTTDVPANLGPVRDVGTNSYSSCALKPDGETVCWGTKVLFNDPARLKPRPMNLKLKAIKGQFGGMCGIQLDDTLVCWGDEKTSHLSVPPGTKVLIP